MPRNPDVNNLLKFKYNDIYSEAYAQKSGTERAKNAARRSDERHKKNESDAKYSGIIYNATEEVREALYLLHKEHTDENRAEFTAILKRMLKLAHPIKIHQKKALYNIAPYALKMSMSVDAMCNVLYDDTAHTEELFGIVHIEEDPVSRIIRSGITLLTSSIVSSHIMNNTISNSNKKSKITNTISLVVGLILGGLSYAKKLFIPTRNANLRQLTRKAMKKKYKKARHSRHSKRKSITIKVS